jgi:hypothetical protein
VNGDAEYHEAGEESQEVTTGTGVRLVPTRVAGTPQLASENT